MAAFFVDAAFKKWGWRWLTVVLVCGVPPWVILVEPINFYQYFYVVMFIGRGYMVVYLSVI